ncbi:hypothetical protein BJ912DRAFT_963279 [Pholiota molesta]|nr:hypothetical protein BJ912DRAFT_963279 [Pholiota molesta]
MVRIATSSLLLPSSPAPLLPRATTTNNSRTYGREITHNERRELFEALEERDPELATQAGRDFEELEQREPVNIAAFKGITERVIRLAKKKHAEQQAGWPAPHPPRPPLGHGGNFGPTQQQPENPYQGRHYLEARGLRHWLKGKLSGNRSQTQPTDTGSDTLAARAYDDYVEARHELEMRDIAEELVARAPGLVRWVKNKLHRKQGAADESQQQQYQPQQQYKRSFDDARSSTPRPARSWRSPRARCRSSSTRPTREPAPGVFHRKQSVDESQQQQYQRSFDDVEELDARDPGVVSWARSKFHRKQSADESQQQYQREFFDDAEELEMREFDEDFEDMLARDYDYFDELD